MAINAYTGLMGSGKSYEVVSEVIIPAIAAGRRVVTNVDGIENDLIREYIFEKKNIPMKKLGHVIHCTNEDIFKDDFFPYYDDQKSAVTDTFVQPGDLVAIDESWRFWGTDCKIPKNHRSFFLEHRHFVDEHTHIACDLVLMIQDMGTLHRSVRAVIAFSFRTHKKVSLGMTNTYSVNMWEGSKMTAKSSIGNQVRKYNSEIFPLYSSFKGGAQGNIVNVDKRQNILRNPRLWSMVILFLIIAPMSVIWTIRYFKHGDKTQVSVPVAVSADTKVVPSNALAAPIHEPKKAAVPEYSETWRVTGLFEADGKRWLVVSNGAGRLRVESPSVFSISGLATIGDIDNEKTTYWSGSIPSTSGGNARKTNELVK